jgi:transcriptional regulator with XRE-family HTH domain
MGYRGRPVADWETGRRSPTAATTLRLCGLSGVDVPAAFVRFHPPSAAALGAADDAGIAAWLRELRSSTAIVVLAERSGLPRFSISRWLQGTNRPRLPQFLRLVDALTGGRAPDLVAELTDVARLPSLREVYARRLAAKELAFGEPWSAAILRVVETEAYERLGRHRPGWISDVLGIDPEIERRCLSRLAEAGMVRVDESGKVRCVPSTVDTSASDVEMRALKSHWAHVGLERLERGDPDDLFAFNLISVSRADADAIRQLLRATYREIRSLVAASSPVQEVALLQLQLATWHPTRRGDVES